MMIDVRTEANSREWEGLGHLQKEELDDHSYVLPDGGIQNSLFHATYLPFDFSLLQNFSYFATLYNTFNHRSDDEKKNPFPQIPTNSGRTAASILHG